MDVLDSYTFRVLERVINAVKRLKHELVSLKDRVQALEDKVNP